MRGLALRCVIYTVLLITLVPANSTAVDPTTVNDPSSAAPTSPVSSSSTAAPTQTTVNGPSSAAPTSPVSSSSTVEGSPVTGSTIAATAVSSTNDASNGATSLSTDNITKETATPAPSTYCASNPCGTPSATCIELNNNYTCQCPLNYYFDNSDCKLGSSFYGNLKMSVESFNPDKTSKVYTDLYYKIKNYFKLCLQNFSGYSETVIVEISAQNSRLQARNQDTVNVKLSHIFTSDTQDEMSVNTAIEEYFKSDKTVTYTKSDICQGFYCEEETTNCTIVANSQLPKCNCLPDRYASTETSCRACKPDCDLKTSQCIQATPTDISRCVCRPGYKESDGKCKQCSFGTSGDNCEDNTLLILVIVGAVGGVLVISLLGAVIGVSVKSKKRKGEDKNQLIKSEQSSSPVIGGGLFPKVQAQSDQGYVNRGANPYDNSNEYKRPTPNRDYDEDPWYEMSSRNRQY